MERPLAAALLAASHLLPEEFRRAHVGLFIPEHLDALAARLLACHASGPPAVPPLPHFAAEQTPPLGPAWEPFRDPVRAWVDAADSREEETLAALAAAFPAAGTASLLLLVGQRLTPGSVADVRAIPPPREDLLAAATRPHRGGPLSAAARAIGKHHHRPDGEFWGQVRGPAEEKNRAAGTIVADILGRATWWNVFHHPLHGLLYEARVPSGHGARWALPGPVFVGFVDPFDEPGGEPAGPSCPLPS